MKKKYAVIVVDMLNDFVSGALSCDNGKAIVPALTKLCTVARDSGIPIIFANDAHIRGVDKELKLWGDHAIAGTTGANVITEMNLCDKDYVIPKRHYSAFWGTDLDILLRDLKINTCIITGLHTHMCCRHTAADAYQYGYDIIVPLETTASFTEDLYNQGIQYFKDTYGAEICHLDDLLMKF